MSMSLAKRDITALPKGRHLIRVGQRPGFSAFVLRGTPGPIAVINAGTHGDEYEGPTVLRELVEMIEPRKLTGTLVIIPVLHEAAFFGGTRCHPIDGSNLARVFPGDPRGNNSARVAHLFLRKILRHADYYIDLHSGGVSYDLLPWVGFMQSGSQERDQTQARMTACFDDYWCWSSRYNPGRTISAAADAGIPAIYAEALGGGGVGPVDQTGFHRGLKNFLMRFGFLAGKMPRLKPQVMRVATSNTEAHIQLHHPAPVAGLFIRVVEPGHKVQEGGRLGEIHALGKRAPVTVRASHAGTVVSLRRQRSVAVGDALATVVALPKLPR